MSLWDQKGDADGSLLEFKARLIACKNCQGLPEFHPSIYVYVVSTTNLRVIFALIAQWDLEYDQIDVITPNLNAHMNSQNVVLFGIPPG